LGDTRLQIIAPLLRTLCVLHEQHIVHRDIKQENIFLTWDGTRSGHSDCSRAWTQHHACTQTQPVYVHTACMAKMRAWPCASADQLRLGDFGLAIQQREELPFLRAGTLDYMAPEVGWGAAEGSSVADRESATLRLVRCPCRAVHSASAEPQLPAGIDF
jgi:serine/threonine protein kinase